MFGLKRLFKKPDQEQEKQSKITRFKGFVKNKSHDLGSFFADSLNKFVNEFIVMHKRSKNLMDTNMKLGLKHLHEENFFDAMFRFRFVRFFWPKCYAASYYLAYCYAVKNKKNKARALLTQLLKDDPQNERAVNLLKKIDE